MVNKLRKLNEETTPQVTTSDVDLYPRIVPSPLDKESFNISESISFLGTQPFSTTDEVDKVLNEPISSEEREKLKLQPTYIDTFWIARRNS